MLSHSQPLKDVLLIKGDGAYKRYSLNPLIVNMGNVQRQRKEIAACSISGSITMVPLVKAGFAPKGRSRYQRVQRGRGAGPAEESSEVDQGVVSPERLSQRCMEPDRRRGL